MESPTDADASAPSRVASPPDSPAPAPATPRNSTLCALVDLEGKGVVIDLARIRVNDVDEVLAQCRTWLQNSAQLHRLEAIGGGPAWRREVHASEINIARKRLHALGAIADLPATTPPAGAGEPA